MTPFLRRLLARRLKNQIKPWLVEEWCIPKAGAEFIAAMEDVLEVYQRPYDPEYPVVCLDESSRQLIEESRTGLPVKPGNIQKVDYEYRRNGVVDFFMMFEPLVGKRYVEVRDSRKRADFAYCIKQLVDVGGACGQKVGLQKEGTECIQKSRKKSH